MIDGAFFMDDVVSLGLQARLFERAPVGEFDQLAQLQFLVTLFGARMVRLVGQEVTPCDQLVTAHLRVPPDAECIYTKGLGQVKKIITYVG